MRVAERTSLAFHADEVATPAQIDAKRECARGPAADGLDRLDLCGAEGRGNRRIDDLLMLRRHRQNPKMFG
jgi:hypothetical protein